MNGLKEAFSRENLLKNLNFFALLNLGLVLTAVGIVYFKNPNHFAFGGTSGLSILLADLFPHINVGGFMWIINLVLVVLGGGGAFAYIKFIRPKQASKASADPDDYDFADEEEYINEDEPEQEEETEDTK